MRESSARWARISRAPSAQLRPIESGWRGCSEYQKAVGVWPESVRPERSVIVPEIITGRLAAELLEHVVDAGISRLGIQRIEDRLDQQNIGAAFDERFGRLGIGGAQFVES